MGNLQLKTIVLCFMFIFVLSSAPAFSRTDLISTSFHNEETPTIVVDASENAHIIWSSQSGESLYYRMVDNAGNTIIGPTNLTPAADPDYHVRRPSVEIDASGDIHIVFHGEYLYTDYADEEYAGTSALNAHEVIYTKIDPAAYIAGGQSDLDDLIEIPETIISTDDGNKSRAPNAALDGSGQLHVTWFDDLSGFAIHYRVLDLNAGEIAAEAVLTTGLDIDVDWGEPEIAVDGNGNGHIVYSVGTTGSNDSTREIYYIMVGVSGSTISELIADTRITDADGTASVRAHLVTDSSNMVHVVWHNGSDEVFYSKLDPSLDDQDGGPADPNVISLIQEDRATPDNGEKSNQKNIAVDSSGRLHLAYADGDGPDDLYYMVLDTSSTSLSVVEPATRVTNGDSDFYPCYWYNSSSRHPEVALGTDGRVFITFSAYEDDYDVYLAISPFEPPAAIPTLNEWGMILLALLIFGTSIFMIRKNQVNP